MATTIFFSWQGDTPTEEGRNLVERALERAAANIGSDASVEVPVRDVSIDTDTKGVPGSPPIVDTIFRKIDNAAVFVPDLTFVGNRLDGRPTPNPNVMIEYGWALKSLGYGRIVPIMNSAYGEPAADAMPFNMRHLRNPIVYHCAADADEETRKKTCETLAKSVEQRLREVLVSDSFKATLPKPPVPPTFHRREPQNGQGRFRQTTQALGFVEPFMKDPHEVKLTDSPVVWFRVMPTLDPVKTWSVTDIKKAATQGAILSPLNQSWSNLDFIRAADGFGVFAPISRANDETCAVVFAFTTGEVWSIDSYALEAMIWNNRKVVPLYEGHFRRALVEYSAFLVKLGMQPPFRWIAGMEDLKGRGISLSRPGYSSIFPGPAGNCVEDAIVEEGLHSPGTPPALSLRPFFERIFDACGLDYPEWWHEEKVA